MLCCCCYCTKYASHVVSDSIESNKWPQTFTTTTANISKWNVTVYILQALSFERKLHSSSKIQQCGIHFDCQLVWFLLLSHSHSWFVQQWLKFLGPSNGKLFFFKSKQTSNTGQSSYFSSLLTAVCCLRVGFLCIHRAKTRKLNFVKPILPLIFTQNRYGHHSLAKTKEFSPIIAHPIPSS